MYVSMIILRCERDVRHPEGTDLRGGKTRGSTQMGRNGKVCFDKRSFRGSSWL